MTSGYGEMETPTTTHHRITCRVVLPKPTRTSQEHDQHASRHQYLCSFLSLSQFVEQDWVAETVARAIRRAAQMLHTRDP